MAATGRVAATRSDSTVVRGMRKVVMPPRLSTELRFAALVVTGILILVAAWEASIVWPAALRNPVVPPGMDVGFYLTRTHSWLAGTGFYLPRQLTGSPYEIRDGDALYPPPSLLLFLPWALGVPMILWWLIPLGLIALSIARARPPVAAWPLLAAILVYPRTWTVLVLGNPSLWAIAAVAAGSAWGWPAVGALLKPVFAPFAVLGFWDPAHRRGVVAACIAFSAIALVFLPMWPDYITVLSNARTDRGPEYTLGELPIAFALAIGLATRRLRHCDPVRTKMVPDWSE